MKIPLKLIAILLILFTVFVVHNPHVYACTSTGSSGGSGTAGANPGNGGSGTAGGNACLSGGGGGGGGGGGASGGTGGNGAGGTVVLKNTSNSMTLSGTVDVRGGGSSTTNGGTVKLFYTGSAPSTAGVTSGRTYSTTATSQLSSVCTPKTVTDDASIGTTAWTNLSNASEQDAGYATNPGTTSTVTSHYLVLTGCGLAIPAGSSITGVRVDFLRYEYNPSSITVHPADVAVRLVKGGAIQSTNQSAVGWNPATPRWDTYGSNSNLWGATLTSGDVNSSGFGVAIATTIPWSVALGDNSFPEIDSTHITVYYNLNSTPAAPTLSAPSSGATNVSTAPTFQFKTTDADNDYLKYKVIIYNSDCATNPQIFDQVASQTGWTGQDQQTSTAYTGNSVLSSSTTASFNGVSLAGNTTYCWKAAAIDPGGSNVFGSYSGTQTFTTTNSTSPSAPTLLAPATGATGTSTSPLFQLRASDADNDYLKYKVVVYNSDCSTNPQTFDQTSSQVGWTGQDQQANTAYTGSSTLSNSTIANFGLSNLSASTQYCWKAAAIDPGGTNTFGSFSPTQLFTTGASNSGTVNIRGGSTVRGGAYVR